MPATIKEIFDTLSANQKAILNYAFENGIDQYVILGDKVFIGVNLAPSKRLIVEMEAGKWSAGKVQQS